jgi:hypothetical protein
MTDLFTIASRPVWAIICPAIVALLILLSGKRPNLRETWTLLGSAVLCYSVISMTPAVLEHGPIRISWFVLFPQVDFAFKAHFRHDFIKFMDFSVYLFHRLHAVFKRACPDAILLFLCAGIVGRHRDRAVGKFSHDVYFL